MYFIPSISSATVWSPLEDVSRPAVAVACSCRILCVLCPLLFPEAPVIWGLPKGQCCYLAGSLLEIWLLFSISTRGWKTESKKCWDSNQCVLLPGYSSGKWLDQKRTLKLYGFHSHLAHFPKVLLASGFEARKWLGCGLWFQSWMLPLSSEKME